MKFQCSLRFHGLSPIRNISYLLPMCCSFGEKRINSQKNGLGCSTPLRAVPLIPSSCCIRWNRMLWLTVSKAALKSSNTRKTPCRWWRDVIISSLTFNNAVSVLCAARYADCSGSPKLFSCICLVIVFTTILSITLDKNLMFDTTHNLAA